MEEIKVFDFYRIFLGNYPLLFLLEIVFRTVIMYCYTILLLRFLGKRGMGQLSNLELAIIICFGSAVGDPMIGAEMPIIYGVTAITTVAFMQVGMEKFINRNKRIEQILEGLPECLVDDGLIRVEKLRTENLSHADLFRALRNKDVIQLGEINKAYFETSGDITVLFHNRRNIKPGLSIIPIEDAGQTYKIGDLPPVDGAMSCIACGHTKSMKANSQLAVCPNCGKDEWIQSTFD